jgi:hypothetical protein
MKIVINILIGLISLLALAAGVAKVMKAPEEVAFLQSFGLSELLIMVYGAVQMFGAILFAVPKARTVGALITMLAFGVSSILILASGNMLFGAVSLIPLALIVLVTWYTSKSCEDTKQAS